MSSTHYMRSSIYNLTKPIPARLSHEEEDPFCHILLEDRDPYTSNISQQRFGQRRHERPSTTSTTSSRSTSSTTSHQSLTARSLTLARKVLAQFTSHTPDDIHPNPNPNHNRRSVHVRPPTTLAARTLSPSPSPTDNGRVSRTLAAIRHASYMPDAYVPIDAPRPVITRIDRLSSGEPGTRTSVVSSHCLVSGNATRRGSRYFGI